MAYLSKPPKQRTDIVGSLTIITLSLLFWFILMPVSCRCGGEDEVRPDAPEVVRDVAPDPIITAEPVPPPPPPAPEWTTVSNLDALTGKYWGEATVEGLKNEVLSVWFQLRIRADVLENNEEWGLPYPYHFRMAGPTSTSEPWDCGVFDKLHDDWRVGYCMGGTIKGGRTACRIELHFKDDPKKKVPPIVRVRIGNYTEAFFSLEER